MSKGKFHRAMPSERTDGRNKIFSSSHRDPKSDKINSITAYNAKTTTNDLGIETETSSSIKYWHYKQTGIKSRPIKLLKHPVEHIERKILLSYLLGLLFKIIAILTGPLIVLSIHVILVPSIFIRHSAWFVLNLFDVRIQTKSSSEFSDNIERESQESQPHDSSQIFWSYSPLNYLEVYWLKEKQVNCIVIQLDPVRSSKDGFSLQKLRALLRRQILDRTKFRKFSSRIVARGIPFYQSLYWHYIGFKPDSAELQTTSDLLVAGSESDISNDREDSTSNCSISPNQSLRSLSKCSVASLDGEVKISLAANMMKNERNQAQLRLSDHIYVDNEFEQQANISIGASIRRHVYKLSTRPLDMSKPLWEVRVIEPKYKVRKTASNQNRRGKERTKRLERQIYLLVRCHQSLADGKSLLSILENNLTCLHPKQTQNDKVDEMKTIEQYQSQQERAQLQLDDQLDDEEDEGLHDRLKSLDESRLKPIEERRSFVERVSKAASIRSAIFVGPLTVLLWFVWSFTRRKNNHLNRRTNATTLTNSKCDADSSSSSSSRSGSSSSCRMVGASRLNANEISQEYKRLHWTRYNLTKFHQIKQMTRSTVSDILLCALSGALREYLKKFNCISNPPNLNVSLTVDMRQSSQQTNSSRIRNPTNQETAPSVDLTILNVPLPTAVEGTVPRLWELRNTMDELRHSADPWVMLGLKRILFTLLPGSWYRWTINRLALRNSSVFVSNIRGPKNVVESWCVNLFQRAILEAQQPPKIYKTSEAIRQSIHRDKLGIAALEGKRKLNQLTRSIVKANRALRCELLDSMGSIVGIYYCMQPPTSDIPISFNCITYHNKLFVTSLSHSLLVEDSKLLIDLFFKQLDQMANSIAKRRSLVAIVRHPPKVSVENVASDEELETTERAKSLEIDEQATKARYHPIGQLDCEQNYKQATPRENEEDDWYRRLRPGDRSTYEHWPVARQHKDDLEANIGLNGRTNKCDTCHEQVCVCRRRKSLFNTDTVTRQSLINSLVGSWLPNQLARFKGSGANTSSSSVGSNRLANIDIEQADQEAEIGESEISRSHRQHLECLCGQRLLEELDNDSATASEAKGIQSSGSTVRSRSIDDTNSTSANQANSSMGKQHSSTTLATRFNCPKCKALVTNERSLSSSLSVSRSDVSQRQASGRYLGRLAASQSRNSSLLASRANACSLDICSGTITQLAVPHDSMSANADRLPIKVHSRSDSDLVPANRGSTDRHDGSMKASQRDHSWFGRRVKGRYNQPQYQRSSIRKASSNDGKSSQLSSRSQQDSNEEARDWSRIDPARRRQSLAAITGLSSSARGSIVIKDEVSVSIYMIRLSLTNMLTLK